MASKPLGIIAHEEEIYTCKFPCLCVYLSVFSTCHVKSPTSPGKILLQLEKCSPMEIPKAQPATFWVTKESREWVDDCNLSRSRVRSRLCSREPHALRSPPGAPSPARQEEVAWPHSSLVVRVREPPARCGFWGCPREREHSPERSQGVCALGDEEVWDPVLLVLCNSCGHPAEGVKSEWQLFYTPHLNK